MSSTNAKPFTPRLIRDGLIPDTHIGHTYWEFCLELNVCYICRAPMMPVKGHQDVALFPRWSENNQRAQMERAGIFAMSGVEDKNHDPICAPCANAGRATIICHLCNAERPSSDVVESIGYPAEYLCRQCYEHVPAKRWEEEKAKLNAAHRYDFE